MLPIPCFPKRILGYQAISRATVDSATVPHSCRLLAGFQSPAVHEMSAWENVVMWSIFSAVRANGAKFEHVQIWRRPTRRLYIRRQAASLPYGHCKDAVEYPLPRMPFDNPFRMHSCPWQRRNPSAECLRMFYSKHAFRWQTSRTVRPLIPQDLSRSPQKWQAEYARYAASSATLVCLALTFTSAAPTVIMMTSGQETKTYANMTNVSLADLSSSSQGGFIPVTIPD